MPLEPAQPAADSSISTDHAHLSDLVSRIRSAIDDARVSEARQQLFRLEGLYASHFRREEFIMARINYPALDDHRREHCGLIDTLARINQVMNMENLQGISPAIAAHLETTLRHTIETDRQFLDFMATAA